MSEKLQLTQTEKLRIGDLTDELLKNRPSTEYRNEVFDKISLFIEGIKLGMKAKEPTE